MKPESNLPRIGDLQLRILKELWQRGSASVHEVHAAINSERPLAYTTIATMLRKMEDRGLVCHRKSGRTFVYRPLLKADDVSRSAGRHFVEQIFEGSLLGAVSHLLKTCNATPEELSQLEKAIAEAKRRAK
jgi:predicted transcriptional regulator